MAQDERASVADEAFAMPLTIGATGHRDLRPEDIPILAEAVARVLSELRAACPGTPFVVISPLAEGADQLVAQVALERFGARLIVPLPFERASYETDFIDEAARSAFAALLGQASYSLVLAPSPADEAAREAGYRRAGLWTARHAQVLIALWDGEAAPSDAGTGGIVTARLAGHVSDEHAPLDQAELGLVVHIVTPRASQLGTAAPATAVRRLWPSDAAASARGAEAAHARLLAAIAALNRQARASGTVASGASGWIARGRDQVGAALAAEGARFSWLPALMALCDSGSIAFGARLRSTLVLLIAIALVGVGFAQTAVMTGASGLILGLWGAMAAGYAIWAWARLRGWEAMHQDWRALGEACRVQIYWRIAAIATPVAEAYLTTQAAELDFVRRLVRTADMLDQLADPLGAAGSAAEDRERLGRVVAAWLDEQVRYCIGAGDPQVDGAAGRCARIVRQCRKAIMTCIAFAAAALAAGLIASALAPDVVHFRLATFFMILNVTLPVVAAIGTVQSFLAPSDLVRWYANCGLALGRAGRACRTALAAGRVDEARRVLREAGRVSLAENAAWLILRRQRPLPAR
jgi:hypothetical protein